MKLAPHLSNKRSLKDSLKSIKKPFLWLINEIKQFSVFFIRYLNNKVSVYYISFEKRKNSVVKLFMMKRGRYNRPFLHIATLGIIGVGILIAPILADTYPIFGSDVEELNNLSAKSASAQSVVVGEDVFDTEISEKPRDEVIRYVVQRGDTLSSIAKKFNVSVDTIKWANDISSESISVGDELKILPVTGVTHKVASGETVFSIAKKYDTVPQKIVEYPFNDFANPQTFALVVGQEIVVPDGIKPEAKGSPSYSRRETYVVSGPVAISNSGYTWPVRGGISQFASWYHMALDITAPLGSPIVSSMDGQVSFINLGSWDGGYGNNVLITNGAGITTRYAHMGKVYVSPGQSVSAGQTVIGEVGLTGRTTGPHVHFELMRNGSLVNPLPYLQ